jgi:membrane-bound ClpP family serine protease
MTIAIALILIGLALIVAEVIFIPGTTFVGFIGAAFGLLGIIKIYLEEGNTAGHIALAISLSLFGILFFIILRYNVWSGVSLNDTHTNKVNEHTLDDLHVGTTGVTKSVLKPVGKAAFGDKEYEVQTLGHYVDAGVGVRIIQIAQLKITVETFES